MKKYFLTGLAVCIPIAVTILVIRFVVELLDGLVHLLPKAYQPINVLGTNLPGLGVVLAIVIILLVGFFASNFLGKKLVSYWDKLLGRIPVIRSIYTAVKQVMDTLFSSNDESFKKVLLIEYPRKGSWSIAFQTNKGFEGVPNETDTVTVFIPTTPNPTSGFLMIMPRRDVVELDMSVEQAFKMVVSLGVVT